MSEIYRFEFPAPLVCGILIKRYKRFFVDVRLETGERVVAHCVNTGAMEGICHPGLRVWISPANNPKRKLQWTLELVERDGALIGANTSMPNRIVKLGLERLLLAGFDDWRDLVAEKKFRENSRIDFWLNNERGEHFLEVKNCHLVYRDRRGYFPDSVSARASKHLRDLMEMVHAGHRATALFTAQHSLATTVRPSDAHDPEFAKTAREAAAAGVDFKTLLIRPTVEALIVEALVDADLAEYPLDEVQLWREANKLK